MIEGFDAKLTHKNWAAIGKFLPDTGLLDLNDLVVRGVLQLAGSAWLKRANVSPVFSVNGTLRHA